MNNQKLTDAHTCYKVFRTDLVNSLNLVEKVLIFVLRSQLKYQKRKLNHEVPVSYNGRTHKEGKKLNLLMDLEQLEIIYYNIFLNDKKKTKFFLLVIKVCLSAILRNLKKKNSKILEG